MREEKPLKTCPFDYNGKRERRKRERRAGRVEERKRKKGLKGGVVFGESLSQRGNWQVYRDELAHERKAGDLEVHQ